MWGQGFLHGTQGQLDFLSEKQTDFIFTLFAEEWGFVGGLALMALLLLIVLGAMAIALRCRHPFGRLVSLGIATNFFLYVFVNLAMVMGVIPVGGVPLPLVSHGGSAEPTVMAGFGVLMSAHVHRDVEFGTARGKDESRRAIAPRNPEPAQPNAVVSASSIAFLMRPALSSSAREAIGLPSAASGTAWINRGSK